ncbi:MAG: hypothetical protein IH870_07585 [Chloroflexi bacterium]|nr:hypothetical protein [Chloroflexota bacterium]
MTLTSGNGKVYVTNRDSDTVSVISDVNTPPFTNQSLQDSWGFSASGIGPPFTEVGIMTFDGSGGCNVTSTLNTVGTVTGPSDSDTCTYSMSPNGTGSIAVQFSGDVFPELLVFAILERKTAEKKKADAQEMTFIGLGADGLRGSASRR